MAEPVLLDDVEIKAVTEKALLVKYEDAEHWIPLSQVDLDETEVKLEKGAVGTLAITPWIAKEKGLD